MAKPKLRFPRFTDEWEEKQLKDFMEFKNGLNADKDKFGNGIKFISVIDILNNPFITYDRIRGKIDIDEKTLDSYSVTYGDVLFQRSSETREDAGKSNVYLDRENVATFGGFVIRGKKIEDYSPEFMNSLLKSQKVRKEIISKAQGAQHINVGQETLENVSITLPSMKEQKKIAEFLLSIDDIIQVQEKGLSILEKQKKGIMQKIFSQKVRFKADDGSEYPEWEEKRIGEMSTLFSGGTPKSDEKKFYDGYINFIRSGEIHSDKTELTITEEGLHNSSAKIVNIGDILFALYGATSGEVDISKIDGAINQAILCIRPLEQYVKKFVVELLTYSKKDIINTYLQGGQGNLSAEIIKKLKYKFPIKEEQQKIADCLSAYDEIIQIKKDKLGVWKEIKKGLLQQMFV